jgi:hypothetical protein
MYCTMLCGTKLQFEGVFLAPQICFTSQGAGLFFVMSEFMLTCLSPYKQGHNFAAIAGDFASKLVMSTNWSAAV